MSPSIGLIRTATGTIPLLLSVESCHKIKCISFFAKYRRNIILHYLPSCLSTFRTANNYSLKPDTVSGIKDMTKTSTEPESDVDALPSVRKAKRILELNEVINMSCDTPSVLQIYKQNKDEFEKEHYYNCVSRIAAIQKSGAVPNLLQENTFNSLCYDIWKFCSTIEAHDVLRLYKSFLDCDVPHETLLMQSLLQMMRHQINLLEVADLLHMKRLLHKTLPCKLSQALEKAIPAVLQNHVQWYISPKLQIYQLLQLLGESINGRLKGTEKIIHVIYERKLHDLFNPDDPFIVKNLFAIIWILLDLYFDDDKQEYLETSRTTQKEIDSLLNSSLEELVNKDFSDNSLTKQQIISLTKKLALVYMKGHTIINTDLFCEKVSRIAMEWDITSASQVISAQINMNYIDEELLLHTMDILLITPNALKMIEFNTLRLISAIASLECAKEKCTVDFIRDITNSSLVTDLQVHLPWIKVCLNLMTLNCFPEDILQRLLQEKYLERYFALKMDASVDYFHLLRLQRSLQIMWPESSLKVPDTFIQKISTSRDIKNSKRITVLNHFLKSALGSEYVVSNIFAPYMTQIDHLILLDKERKPVRLQFSYKEFMQLPDILVSFSDVKSSIAIMEIPESWRCRPNLNIRGHFRIEFELVKKELRKYYRVDAVDVIPMFECEIANIEENQLPNFIQEKLKDAIVL